MSVDMASLHPILAERVLHLQEEYVRRFGPHEGLLIVSGLRSVGQQVALYAQGRQPLDIVNGLRKVCGWGPITDAANRRPVTNCDGIRNRSNHQGVSYQGRIVTLAVDVAPALLDGVGIVAGKPHIPWEDEARFLRIGPLAESVGLLWGGNWPKPKTDLPHVEISAEEAQARAA